MPDVRAEIAAHDADFVDVFVSLCNRCAKLWRERNNIRDAMTGGHELPVCATGNLIPPHVAIEMSVHFQWQI